MVDQNKKIIAAVAVTLLLAPMFAQAEETSSTTTPVTTQVNIEVVDSTYIENFKTNFTSYEHPYKVIDEDYKSGKINKATWKAAWEYIATQKKATHDAKKAEYEKNREAKKAEMDAKREEVKKKVEEHKEEMDKKKEEMKKMMEEKRGEMKETREEWKAKHAELVAKYKEAFKAQVEAKLATMNQEQLEKILGNIEKQVQKVQASKLSQEKKDKILAQLHALKELIQSKLDTQMSDDVNVDDLLKTE
jgi:chromosome segregation ATPase